VIELGLCLSKNMGDEKFRLWVDAKLSKALRRDRLGRYLLHENDLRFNWGIVCLEEEAFSGWDQAELTKMIEENFGSNEFTQVHATFKSNIFSLDAVNI
jgi:hypothetical protein